MAIPFGIFGVWTWLQGPEPVYRVSPTTTIAQRAYPEIQINWKGTAIENPCVAIVAFWNQGRTPITSNLLSSTDPLRIELEPAVRVLRTDVVNSSRKTLRVDRIVREMGSKTAVELSIQGVMARGQHHAHRFIIDPPAAGGYLVSTIRPHPTRSENSTTIGKSGPRFIAFSGVGVPMSRGRHSRHRSTRSSSWAKTAI